MPKRLFLTVLFVDDCEIDEAARFLSEVVGMGDPQWHDAPGANCALLFPGWPDDVDSRRVVLGEGPGVVELIAVPTALRDAFPPGPALLSFATPDPDAYAARAAAAGFVPDEVFEVHGTRLAPIRVAGLPWQFTRFAE